MLSTNTAIDFGFVSGLFIAHVSHQLSSSISQVVAYLVGVNYPTSDRSGPTSALLRRFLTLCCSSSARTGSNGCGASLYVSRRASTAMILTTVRTARFRSGVPSGCTALPHCYEGTQAIPSRSDAQGRFVSTPVGPHFPQVRQIAGRPCRGRWMR